MIKNLYHIILKEFFMKKFYKQRKCVETKIYFIFIILLISINFTQAQELPVHEQYIFDYTLVNPSFAGLTQSTMIKLSHRQQWFGFKNPPNTSFLLARHRFKETNLGVGGYIYQDQNGPNSNYGIQASASYHLLLKSNRNKKHILSFGLSLKAKIHVLDESKFEHDIYDPIITYGKNLSYLFNSNAGILYSTTKFFLGYSADNLLPFVDNLYKSNTEPRFNFIHNVHIGKVWEFKNNHQIRVSAIYKTDLKIHSLMQQLDASLRYYYQFGQQARSKHVRYKDMLWGGINYKQTLDLGNFSPLSISPVLGYTKNIYSVAISYDYPMSPISKYSFGSVQVMLSVKFAHTDWRFWEDFKVPNFYYDF